MTRKTSRRNAPTRTRAMLVGAAVAGLAAYAGIRFGAAVGAALPAIAAMVGAILTRGLVPAGQKSGKPLVAEAGTDGVSLAAPPQAEVGDSVPPISTDQQPTQRINLFAEPGPGEPDWPVETHEVRLKLDLAQEYLEADQADLAADLLHEVFDLEIAAARKLAVEILRESDDLTNGLFNDKPNVEA